MPESVSVPEKTLEHWSSQYVTYYYRSNVAQWWPTRGEDIDVRWLPPRPGKAVQLELKTTTVAGAGLHDVKVDLGQLWDYYHRPLGRQPFYTFPLPTWHGNLATAANAERRPVTELAFERSGSKWWFANWMILLTTAQVARVLYKELAAHGSGTRDKRERLVRFDLSHSKVRPTVTWGSGAVSSPRFVPWRSFWWLLDRCGDDGWPQLIFLPRRIIPAQGRYERSQVVEMLREAAATPADVQWDDESLVTLEPDQEGNYRITQAPVNDQGGPPSDEPDEVGDHRQIVFISAQRWSGPRPGR